MVAQYSRFANRGQQPRPCVRLRIQIRAQIVAQQFLARSVAQHPHHRVVHVQKSAFRRSEKKSFLDAVVKLAIPPFRLAPVGNVFQHVNRALVLFGCAAGSRRRHQIYFLRRRYDVFFLAQSGVQAKRAGKRSIPLRQGPQTAHRFSYQRHRRQSQVIRQRPVGAHDFPGAVMHHDKIADRVDILHPLALRSFQL